MKQPNQQARILRAWPLILFPACVASLAAFAGCSADEVVGTFTTLSVSDSNTSEPIVGATIEVAEYVSTPNSLVGGLGPSSTTCRPTDDRGESFCQVATVNGKTDDVRLAVNVLHGLVYESLQMDNRPTLTVAGESFRVTIISVQAEAPPTPTLRVVPLSNPVKIEINGFLRVLQICDRDTQTELWRISTGIDLGSYLDRVVVGTIPISFGEKTTEPGVPSFVCSEVLAGQDYPAQSLVVVGTLPFGNVRILSDPFCKDTSGAAINCE